MSLSDAIRRQIGFLVEFYCSDQYPEGQPPWTSLTCQEKTDFHVGDQNFNVKPGVKSGVAFPADARGGLWLTLNDARVRCPSDFCPGFIRVRAIK